MSHSQQVFSGLRPIAKVMDSVLKPALRGRSSHEAKLILDWVKIIKPELAQRCRPEKLIRLRGQKEGGTLVVATDSSSSLLIQHSEPLLVDCINAYFGYKIVGKIKLKHANLSFVKKEKNPAKEIVYSDETKDPFLEAIKDDALKKALAHFKAVYYSHIPTSG